MNISKQKIVLIAVLLAISIALAITSKVFLTLGNFFNILRQISLTLISASATILVMISGGIDLSVGSVAAFSGCVASGLAADGVSIPVSFFIGSLIGLIMGIISGSMIVVGKVSPFIATLGMMYIGRGLTWLYSGGVGIYGVPQAFSNVGKGFLGPFPTPVVIMVVIVLIFWFLLTRTLVGRYAYMIGGGIETARLSGINVGKYKFIYYTLSGLMAGVAGVLLASRLGGGTPMAGTGFEFQVIVALVIGGVSLSGGEGTIGGMILGGLLVTIMENGFNLLGVVAEFQMVVRGLLLVFAVLMDVNFRGEGINFKNLRGSLVRG